MSFLDLSREVGPALALVVVIIWAAISIAKTLAPKAFDALTQRTRFRAQERAKAQAHQRDLEEEEWAAERQEEVALWSQMVRLQTQVISQNEKLLEFVTDRLDHNLRELSRSIQEELKDIDKRWLRVSQELSQSRGEQQILKIEVSRLTDQYKSIEERIVSLVAFGLEKGQ